MSQRELLRKCTLDDVLGKDRFNVDPINLPVWTSGFPEWDCMKIEERDRIMGGMLRNLVRRTKASVPLYRDDPRWEVIKIDDITDIKDINELPLISKDPIPGTGTPTTPGVQGFRQKVLDDPNITVPENICQFIYQQEDANSESFAILEKYRGQKILEFGSGGSLGSSTKTRLSYLTVEAESYALTRCLSMNGFQSGQRIACFYAPDHKGGLQLERAADIMSMEFHSKNKIFASLANNPDYEEAVAGFKRAFASMNSDELESYGSIIRKGIREYIKANQINVIESVQPPPEFSAKNAKGSSLAFMSIYNEDPTAFDSVSHIFLTGFPLPPETYEHLRANGKSVSTTWGSTEAMALATQPHSQYANDLIATPFPTVGVVAKYQERGLNKPLLKEVPVGTDGLLFITSLLGVGSTYINYQIGDLATRTDRGYKNINRASPTTNIAGSCAEDALSL